MTIDVTDLRHFYGTPLGAAVVRHVGVHVRERWPSLVGQSVMGLGYAPPFLEPFREEAMRSFALMPAEQGVIHWPARGEPCATALVDDRELPLPTGSIDRALLVHGVENSHHPGEMLREVWRVLDAGGRLLMIVPNRGGWWARAEKTPFGQGKPYTRMQLTTLLRDTFFSPLDWSAALHFLPSQMKTMVGLAPLAERVGRSLAAPFAGVHVVEAMKQVYSPIPLRSDLRFARQFKPVLAPGAEPARRLGRATIGPAAHGASEE